MIKPIVTEKTVKNIEIENAIVFSIPRKMNKKEIKKSIEKMFGVKVKNIRTNIRTNKKYAIVRLEKNFKAIDIATKLGMM